ncbi:MAG: CoA ester lyase [Chloroflexota bacterium]|nr:CoA ester lyase [Chloroflexota bacterium]
MKVDGITIRRTYMEVPTMDDKKWDRIPNMAADVFMADIEDSVPPELKCKARDKVVSLIKDPSFFGGREFICRPNNLDTEWGRDDLEALAQAHAPFLLYPKVRSVTELREVKGIFERQGATPEIMLIIETPQAVLHLEEIAAVTGVSGLLFGPGDLSLETGIALLDGREAFKDAFLYPRSKVVMVARALGLEAAEGLFVADLKDEQSVKRAAAQSKLFGFTGNMTFYPPHIGWIHEVRTPQPEEVAWSRRVVDAYKDARAKGQGAVTIDGRWLTIHQFTEAQRALKVAAALGLN